jgi:hypothetical protein
MGFCWVRILVLCIFVCCMRWSTKYIRSIRTVTGVALVQAAGSNFARQNLERAYQVRSLMHAFINPRPDNLKVGRYEVVKKKTGYGPGF